MPGAAIALRVAEERRFKADDAAGICADPGPPGPDIAPPEPANWAQLVLGFGGRAALLRHRFQPPTN